jgi:hypothetical protein
MRMIWVHHMSPITYLPLRVRKRERVRET